ncbi:hypothetical protein [Spirosoma jeollabukense]
MTFVKGKITIVAYKNQPLGNGLANQNMVEGIIVYRDQGFQFC